MCGEKKFIRDEGELFHVNDFIGDVYRSELCLGREMRNGIKGFC